MTDKHTIAAKLLVVTIFESGFILIMKILFNAHYQANLADYPKIIIHQRLLVEATTCLNNNHCG